MKSKPYIGITGVTSLHEAHVLLAQARELGLPEDRDLMLGYLMSYKGLNLGQVGNPRQYPSPASLTDLMPFEPECMNTLHFNSRAAGLANQLLVLIELASQIDCIQLNMAWPDVGQLKRFRSLAYVRVILQVSSRACAMLGWSIEAILQRLWSYSGFVDYVLLDLSGGVGKPMDLGFITECLSAIYSSGLGMSIGVAGGLGPDTMASLEPLLERWPKLSWDAQARLRDQHDGLDLDACRKYLETSIRLALLQTKS